MQTNLPANDRVLRIGETTTKAGMSRSSLYEAVKAGTFPAPLKLSKRSSGWLESEVNAWLAQRASERKGVDHG